ncbi:MAG: hypothetical protein AAB368_10875, partial [bacterium]
RARSIVRPGVAAIAMLGTLWWIHTVAQSGLRPDYAVGLMIAPAIVGGGLYGAGLHLAYALVVVAACAVEFLGMSGAGVNPAFVVLCVATMVGMMHLLLRGQLAVHDRLLASEDLREIMFERTTEGLAVADPLHAEFLLCNGRARVLLGIGPGPGADALGALLAGREGELRLIELLAITREIGERGAWRREVACTAPGGRPFAGDVSVTSARSGGRELWLIRVAERAAV